MKDNYDGAWQKHAKDASAVARPKATQTTAGHIDNECIVLWPDT